MAAMRGRAGRAWGRWDELRLRNMPGRSWIYLHGPVAIGLMGAHIQFDPVTQRGRFHGGHNGSDLSYREPLPTIRAIMAPDGATQ